MVNIAFCGLISETRVHMYYYNAINFRQMQFYYYGSCKWVVDGVLIIRVLPSVDLDLI